MPAAATKQSSAKKVGAPKAKGAVRAKSGCYTCRIRRKKCDERANDAGHCQTCVRLRLQCLGFGAKRPEWLRESRNVSELREKIKTFLAAQGMIKGHSGSGPRNAEQEPPMLRLAEDYSSSSESPPTPTLSLVEDIQPHHHHHHGLTISAMRDQSWASINPTYDHGLNSSHVGIRHESPFGSSQGSYHSSDILHPYQPSLNSSTSLVSWNPALSSSFSTTYHQRYTYEDSEPDPFSPNNPGFPYVNPNFYPDVDELVAYYMDNVVKIQYLLTDPRISDLIFQTTISHPFHREAVRLLAGVHRIRGRYPSGTALAHFENQPRYIIMRSLLGQDMYTAEDAMAALQVVSSFLFDGGRGEWSDWLKVAYRHADSILFDQRRYHGPADALMNCGEKDAFAIRTAIWFDVLASVTTQTSPHFLETLRLMFRPGHSGIHDPFAPLHPQLSMMSVMGCENHIVWAMAETSYLSSWKQQQVSKGCLSVPDLVTRAAEIEMSFAVPPSPEPMADRLEICRYRTSQVFRAAARVYLRSVVSGDHPSVPEIIEGVEETISCLDRVPPVTADSRSVVRSTVCSIFICGCLTDNPSHRSYLLARMKQEEAENMGNCTTTRSLMEQVWQERDQKPKDIPVPWREQLKNSKMLLV